MHKSSAVSLLIFVCATLHTKAQSFEHKTLISGMVNYSKVSSSSNNENSSTFTNSLRTLRTELSAVYFFSSKIGLGFSGALNNISDSYSTRQVIDPFITATTDSFVTRETGGAIRLDVMLLEKNKFSFGFKNSGGSYIFVKKRVFSSETINPPSSFTNTTEETTKGNTLRISVVPVLYYEITKHILAQLSYASIFYSKATSQIVPPAKQNGFVETAYGLNVNYSSLELGLSLLF
jgi:hypothetical protein